MSDLEIIGEFHEDEDISVPITIQSNPEAAEIRAVFVNIENSAKRIIMDVPVQEKAAEGDAERTLMGKARLASYAGPGTYRWDELIVTDKDGNQYNEWGNEIAIDDPHINRAIRVLPERSEP